MKRLLLTLALPLAFAYGAICLAMFLKQRSLIYQPTPAGSDHGAGTTLPVPSAMLQVPGAMLRLAARPIPGTARAVLYFGGNAEDVSLTLPDLVDTFRTHSVYAMHYRGYGGSGGSPSEAALVADALALFDLVHRQHPQIVVVGRSLGSGVAVQLATRRPVDRLVLVTPFDSLQRVAQAQYPWLPVGWLLKDKFESWRHAPQVNAPTRIVVAGEDSLIPPRHARALLQHFRPGIATLVEIPQAGHNDISSFPDYRSLLAHGTDGR
jgi:pimeloyl-ACP methyl ester carboxylesterase